MLRVAYLGNFRPEHSTETHISKTLQKLGYHVHQIQEDERNADQIYADVINSNSDLFLWTRTWGVQGDMPGVLAKLKSHSIPTVSFHLDLYFGIARGNNIDSDPFWQTEYVFTPDGGHDKEFKEHNINHFYLKPGVFEDECNFGNPKQSLSYNVSFVGSEQYHPEWPYRPQLVGWLRNTFGQEFGKFGYPEASMRNQDLNDLYASARVIVGDSLCVGFDHPYYWSDRVYETLGRGGFLIHPYIKGMEEEFVDGIHLVFYKFGDFEELKEKINYYLAHPLLREKIRAAGNKVTRENYTYTQRMKQMLDILSKHSKAIKEALK